MVTGIHQKGEKCPDPTPGCNGGDGITSERRIRTPPRNVVTEERGEAEGNLRLPD